MKVLIDENLPPRLARALHELLKPQHQVYASRALFGTGVKDLDWMARLNAEGGWVVISGDRRITRNKHEAAAFRASNMIGFFLSKGLQKSPLLKQMERLCALWPSIEAQTKLVAGGAMFELQMKSTKLSQMKA
ncbi:hypothetical protein [Hansschlegelia zhihuaiae]|uniref:VapC45 PIN like domain-containing protein n=1 Tax=Hansschlegelia zhihuaiae TaxID=405005 RepID=A0A4V1KI64_9HYPH|nr:hypothetical protein [Hansschlegelia zhihuaiae]RXF69602.1 hypothetical protein EK403_18570 [Hansschlegelia zhihuaiae]